MKKALLLFLISSLPALAGDVSGKVQLTSKPRARARGQSQNFRGNEPRYSNLRTAGYHGGHADPNDGPSEKDLAAQDEVQSVVIEVLDGGGKLENTPLLKEAGRNIITQKNKNFIPHVAIVPRGSKVYFVNADPFLHHIYSTGPDDPSFELPEHTGKVSHAFPRPGILELFCGLHPRMNAYIYVSQSNFATRPGPNHQYRLNNLPAGKYKIRVWHPRHPERTLDVTVPSQGTVNLDISL